MRRLGRFSWICFPSTQHLSAAVVQEIYYSLKICREDFSSAHSGPTFWAVQIWLCNCVLRWSRRCCPRKTLSFSCRGPTFARSTMPSFARNERCILKTQRVASASTLDALLKWTVFEIWDNRLNVFNKRWVGIAKTIFHQSSHTAVQCFNRISHINRFILRNLYPYPSRTFLDCAPPLARQLTLRL